MRQSTRWKWAAGLLGVMLLAGCQGDAEKVDREKVPFSEGRPYREKYVGYGESLRAAMDEGRCELAATCGDFSLITCRVELDGPEAYVHSPTWQVLEVCGGECMFGPQEDTCVACPPPEWTCQR